MKNNVLDDASHASHVIHIVWYSQSKSSRVRAAGRQRLDNMRLNALDSPFKRENITLGANRKRLGQEANLEQSLLFVPVQLCVVQRRAIIFNRLVGRQKRIAIFALKVLVLMQEARRVHTQPHSRSRHVPSQLGLHILECFLARELGGHKHLLRSQTRRLWQHNRERNEAHRTRPRSRQRHGSKRNHNRLEHRRRRHGSRHCLHLSQRRRWNQSWRRRWWRQRLVHAVC